jgi:hypothetical protein
VLEVAFQKYGQCVDADSEVVDLALEVSPDPFGGVGLRGMQ